jgi:acyl dehydratase
MATTAGKLTFDDIAPGDALTPFTIGETQETIDGARLSEGEDMEMPRNIHTDPEFAKEGMFGGTLNAGVTTMAYLNQMLEHWLPNGSLYGNGRLLFKAIEPFRPGDTVEFTGTVTGKRVEGGQKLVDCEIKGINQGGKLIGVAEATLAVSD